MNAAHESPDASLRFVVQRDKDGGVSIGFEGFARHTHADVLAATYGIANEAAVKRFVGDLLNNRSIIVILRRGKTVVDI